MSDESPENEAPGKTYRTKGTLRPAQHRFLFLGALLVLAIAGVLAFLNEKMKEETAFTEKMQFQERSITAGTAAGLAYDKDAPVTKTEPDVPPQAEAVTPSAGGLPEPTNSAPPSE